MRDLVPIKVKIGLKSNGHAKYPNFNQLYTVQVKGMDWAHYVDTMGLSWHYDKTSGHKEDTADSPFGQQWGMLIVPKEFADEAILAFPDTVSKMTEVECEDFYDNKAHAHEPDELVDEIALKAFEIKEKMGVSLSSEEKIKKDKALDPNDPTPGIKKNLNKKWVDFKALKGVNIVQ
jgi:hypothetical protein